METREILKRKKAGRKLFSEIAHKADVCPRQHRPSKRTSTAMRSHAKKQRHRLQLANPDVAIVYRVVVVLQNDGQLGRMLRVVRFSDENGGAF